MRSVAVEVKVDDQGQPRAASAEARLEHSPARIWRVIEEVDRYPDRVPMIHKVRLSGDRAHVDLKFKIALFSVGFSFVVDVKSEKEKWLELKWVSGEPRDIVLRFDLEPLDDGKACLLRSTGAFDATSLGWLAKYFLRHHPEIQFGIMPGVAIGLLESMRRAADG